MNPSDAPPDAQPLRDIRWSEAPYIVGSGFCMGTADVVPGVSGGTMAVALGIYRQFLGALSSIDISALRSLASLRIADVLARVHWRFLAAVACGMGLGIGVMIKVVRLPYLLETYPTRVYAAFFGLVLASAIVLARGIPGWGLGRVASFLFGAAFGFTVVNLVPVQTPESAAFIFASGVVSICAMLLPGISGSFVLLILGKYAYVLDAVGRLDFAVIVPFALGAGIGIVTFARVVGWALARFHDTVLAALTGLLVGSLWRIWPYQELTTVIVRDKPRVIGAAPYLPESPEWSVIALGVGAFLAVLVLERVAKRRAQ